MIRLRKSSERGSFNLGWLQTRHSFSFGDYYDPEWIHFRSLRVINEDVIAPGQGFPEHSHRDMEIVTYMLAGSLRHGDSLGNSSVIQAGEVQRMSAGSGVIHSEYNASDRENVHLLQIWLMTDKKGITPEYEQKSFSSAGRANALRLIVSSGGTEASLGIHQDVNIYDCLLERGRTMEYAPASGRHIWIQVIRGQLSVGSAVLSTGDGAGISKESRIQIRTDEESVFLLFDLS